MKTHNELFAIGKKVEAYLLFKKETGTKWSFETYVKKMKFHNKQPINTRKNENYIKQF